MFIIFFVVVATCFFEGRAKKKKKELWLQLSHPIHGGREKEAKKRLRRERRRRRRKSKRFLGFAQTFFFLLLPFPSVWSTIGGGVFFGSFPKDASWIFWAATRRASSFFQNNVSCQNDEKKTHFFACKQGRRLD